MPSRDAWQDALMSGQRRFVLDTFEDEMAKGVVTASVMNILKAGIRR